MRYLLALLACCACAYAAPVTFTWDHPDLGKTNAPTGYRLYANTNVINLTTPLVKIETGTNRIVTVDSMDVGRWVVWATAYTKGTNTDGSVYTNESDPSAAVQVVVPNAPTNMAVLAVQWIGTLASTNWTDIGFFRLKIGAP